MKKLSVIVVFILIAGQVFAQKYSVLVPDILVPKELFEERTKLTYVLRGEFAAQDFFAVVNKNTTAQIIKPAGTTSYSPNEDLFVDTVTEAIYKNNIDFAFVADVMPDNGGFSIKLVFLGYGGRIYEETIAARDISVVEHSLKELAVRTIQKLKFSDSHENNSYEYEEMVLIPGGTAIIGSFNADPDEAPKREVVIPAFYMDKYEVTNLQYKRFIDATGNKPPENVINSDYTLWVNGSFPKELENHAVVNVTWYDAKAYCEWAGKRLPTAAEWEKAARGPYGNIYPWGNEFFEGYANLYVKGLSYDKQKTVPVGTYKNSKSYYGIYDLAGNVWEWTADTYKLKNKETASLRKIAKGGGWGFNGNRHSARASYLLAFSPDYTSNCLGFRCVK